MRVVCNVEVGRGFSSVVRFPPKQPTVGTWLSYCALGGDVVNLSTILSHQNKHLPTLAR